MWVNGTDEFGQHKKVWVERSFEERFPMIDPSPWTNGTAQQWSDGPAQDPWPTEWNKPHEKPQGSKYINSFTVGMAVGAFDEWYQQKYGRPFIPDWLAKILLLVLLIPIVYVVGVVAYFFLQGLWEMYS